MLDSSHFVIRSLLEEGRISEEQYKRSSEVAQAQGISTDEALVRMDIITQRDLAIARARICEYPFVELDAFEVDYANCNLIPKKLSERIIAFPLFIIDGIATVAMEDPLNLQGIDQLTQRLGCRIDPVICDCEKLRALIARAYSLSQQEGFVSDDDDDNADELATGDEPIVVAVNQIMFSGIDAGASDIHINPDEKKLILRYRVDGVLQMQQGPDLSTHEGMVQRLKVMAGLDLTQTRRPQDGKFRVHHRGQDVDVRLSLLPTIHGENVVMRLLRQAAQIGSIAELGMPPHIVEAFEEMIHKPHGIILVTGPTGSGKTTTLYTALSQINTVDRNIMTIEDPVEVRLHTIRQVQANAEIGLTFASALRSILRQDPDVVLVGEIRDEETAKIAVQAALTGHLVFSTLHTNDSVGSIARLRDFGVPSFAVNNALLGAMAQRLVRKVCEHCATQYKPDRQELHSVRITPSENDKFVVGKGCPKCGNTGYRGRVGVYEMFRTTPSMKAMIESEAAITDIEKQAKAEGLRSMLDDGIDKARLGLTTIEELGKLNSTLVDTEEPAEESGDEPTSEAEQQADQQETTKAAA